MSVICIENVKWNVIKVLFLQKALHGWYILVVLLEKLILQTVMKLCASRILHWTTRSQFNPFQTLTFRLFSKIPVNIILTLKRFLQKLICSL